MLRVKLLLVFAIGTMALGGALVKVARAAEPLVVLSVEGNPSCNSLASNQQISEIKFSSPTNGTVGSPPEQIAATFATAPNRVLSWSVIQTNPGFKPVNIVIVKGQR